MHAHAHTPYQRVAHDKHRGCDGWLLSAGTPCTVVQYPVCMRACTRGRAIGCPRKDTHRLHSMAYLARVLVRVAIIRAAIVAFELGFPVATTNTEFPRPSKTSERRGSRERQGSSRDRQIQTDRQTDRQRKGESKRERDRDGQRKGESKRERQRQTETDRPRGEAERQRQRDRKQRIQRVHRGRRY